MSRPPTHPQTHTHARTAVVNAAIRPVTRQSITSAASAAKALSPASMGLDAAAAAGLDT